MHKIKDILQFSEKTDEKQVEIEVTVSETKEEKTVKKEVEVDVKQPSIFDF